MSDYEMTDKEEIYSKVLRAGRRTYFFDVRATKAGDYYLTITESKKFTNDDGSYHYKKHKIYLYKEDFSEFKEILAEMTDYIVNEKGEEVLSFGKYRGVTLKQIWNENPGYFSWINQADFPLYTKNVMRNFADEMKLKKKFKS